MNQNDYNIINGLSDAEIMEVKKMALQYDYKQKKPIRNSLEIVLETKQAMVSTAVKSLIFYNYKIIKEDDNFLHSWWMDSEKIQQNGREGLKIFFRCPNAKIGEIIIIFDELEIVKKDF